MDKRPKYVGLGGVQALLSGDIYRRLGKGARDRHTILLYTGNTQVAKMVQMADRARQAFRHSYKESQSSNLTVFFPPLM